MHVLVVARSKFFREALKFILQGRVDSVETATDITGIGDVGRYDLILCDLSCFENLSLVADRLRSFKEKGAKVVVFSFDPADRLRNLMTGADGYIHRPLDPETVMDLISRFS